MKKNRVLIDLRTYFFTGLAAILPIFATCYVIFFLFVFTDSILGRFINAYLQNKLGFYIPGLGIIIFVLLILFAGILAKYLLGRRLFVWFESSLLRIPLIKQIYLSFKQIVEFLFSQKKRTFKKVVLVEYPRKGIWSLGFVTNEGMPAAKQLTSEDLINVFIPSSPGPLTGYLVFVRRQEAIFLDISVEDAIKMVFSGGVLNPGEQLPEARNKT